MKKLLLLLLLVGSLYGQKRYYHLYIMPDSINYKIIAVSFDNSEREVSRERSHYIEWLETNIPDRVFYTAPIQPIPVIDTIYKDSIKYADSLNRTDYMVTRHYEEVLTGSTTTLTTEEFAALVARRKEWRRYLGL